MGYRHLMSAVLVALTVCVAATAAAAARTKDNEGGGAFTSEELQAAIMSFADSCVVTDRRGDRTPGKADGDAPGA